MTSPPKKSATKTHTDRPTPETDEIKSLLPTFIIQIHWLKIFTYTLQYLKPLSPVRKIHREKSEPPYIVYPHPKKQHARPRYYVQIKESTLRE